MGLDMYAHRRLNVKQWGHQKPEEHYSVTVTYGGKPVEWLQSDRISRVEEEVMYWRKANHIHGWFVDNVQNNEDDCHEYLVDYDHLRELHGICQKVIKASKLVDGRVHNGEVYDKDSQTWVVQRRPGKVIEDATVAKRLLPPRQGFFFGIYEYDEEYLNDVIATRDWTASMLSDHEAGYPGDIYYRSSW